MWTKAAVKSLLARLLDVKVWHVYRVIRGDEVVPLRSVSVICAYNIFVCLSLCETERAKQRNAMQFHTRETRNMNRPCTRVHAEWSGRVRCTPIDLQWPKVWQNPTPISCRPRAWTIIVLDKGYARGGVYIYLIHRYIYIHVYIHVYT